MATLVPTSPAPDGAFSHWYTLDVDVTRPAFKSTYAVNIIAAAIQPIEGAHLRRIALIACTNARKKSEDPNNENNVQDRSQKEREQGPVGPGPLHQQ